MMNKRHKWDKKLTKFCGDQATCTVCGLQKESHGALGSWYFSPWHKGYTAPPCISSLTPLQKAGVGPRGGYSANWGTNYSE